MASASIDIYRLGETFYVPIFEVKISGRGLPDDVLRDVMQVTYKDSVQDIDSFDLKVNNWDAQLRTLKYEPASSSQFSGIFDPGQQIELHMGYMGNTRLMLTGQITSLEPDYPQSGPPTLSVRGLNVLHSFRTEQHSYAWTQQRDSDIAQWLGSQPRQANKPGLGIEVRPNPVPNEPQEPYVLMDNQYDIVFLMQRARRHGYQVVLQEEQQNGQTVQYLYFGPSNDKAEMPAYRLEWGKSLASFRPTLSTARQISQVTVRGWDRHSNKLIEGKATWQDVFNSGGPERDRMQVLAQAFGGRTEVVTDRPVYTQQQATRMAKDIMRNQLLDMVTASGTTVGLPDLLSGGKIEIAGIGDRFNGEYFVTETTHTIDDGGYRTTFNAKRDVPPQ